MSKTKRQQKVLELIKQYEIDTQEELTTLLVNSGYKATQATVSRDINELQLVKVCGKQKKYRYSAERKRSDVDSDRLMTLFKNAVVSIEQAQNIIVVKTLISNGGPVGLTVDSLNMKEIIGCVAGDDTLLIVTHNNEDAKIVVEQLKSLI